MPTLKYPFDYNSDGSFVTLEEDTDELFSQLLSVCAVTEPGTFPYSPTYGVFDPTFRSVDRGSYMIQASRFIPEIVITSVDGVLDDNTGATSLKVSYRRV
ncbi:MAG: hypothetical protein EBW15_06920 [Actinobacteria bacterium]|nr:hypothetical protein [Actinomycetota bacterium]